ncbi:MAG: AI-2E family transporter [Chloroflexaceae bacterium]|nr:AI-2E family transporter [Chloroflexaceae bacterium]
MWVVSWAFWVSQTALLPFIVGAILSYLMLPLISLLERYANLTRWLAILIVYTVGLVVLIIALVTIIPMLLRQFSQLTQIFPDLPGIIEEQTEVLADWYEGASKDIPEEVRMPLETAVMNAINQIFVSLEENLMGYVQGGISFAINTLFQLINTVGFLLGFFIVPIWMFYVMYDSRKGEYALDRMMPTWLRRDFWAILRIIHHTISNYFRGQFLLGVVVAVGVWVGLIGLNMAGFKVEFTLLLAVFAGICELIPYIGPILGAVPAVAVGFVDSPTTAIAVAVLFLIVQLLENNFLVPRIQGDSVGLHPAVLMVMMVVCSSALGLVGIILAAPISAVARDIFLYVHGRLSEPPRQSGVLPWEWSQAEEQESAEPDESVSVGDTASSVGS